MLLLFKGFVKQNRPNLDIEKVATGETWFGPDALKEGLVDELVSCKQEQRPCKPLRARTHRGHTLRS